MIQKYNRYLILEEFFNYPLTDFQIRELSRRTKISQPSTINHLKELLKNKLIIKEKKSLYPTYKANRDDELFKTYKQTNILIRLQQTGLINYIYDSCMPDTIVLFGSASKGEDTEKSDIDLLLICKDKKLNLKKYEEKLKRKINILFITNINKLSKELKNNIINGIILKGYLEI